MRSPLLHSPPVQINGILAEGHVSQAFDIGVAANGLSHVRRRQLALRPLTVEQIEADCAMTAEASIESMGQLMVAGAAGDRELLEVNVHHGGGSVRAAADTPADADALLERACAALAARVQSEDPRVPIMFWTLTEHGPRPMQRRLHAPRWDEIASNYLPPVRDALTKIMASPPDTARGIALWQGLPGTGKTTALRALANEWHDEVELHVIVDPEVFLGERASYLVEVLFGNEVDEHWAGADVDHAPRQPARSKLIVLEDAGELISTRASADTAQALSRLLNLTDGMLGQGSNVSVLVTTNEPIDQLHPAIVRPGRGWAHIEFGQLPVDTANGWLAQHGCTDRVDAPATLAQLYGLLRGDQIVMLDTLDE